MTEHHENLVAQALGLDINAESTEQLQAMIEAKQNRFAIGDRVRIADPDSRGQPLRGTVVKIGRHSRVVVQWDSIPLHRYGYQASRLTRDDRETTTITGSHDR